MRFERGFKANCDRIASELRLELQLEPGDRLDPLVLAKHLAIPVHPLADLAGKGASPEAVRRFHNQDRSTLSAFTIFSGRRRVIFYNESHAKTRRSNDLAHELAHAILEHEPGPLYGDDGKKRLWSSEIEREADWLAGVVLVPRAGAFALARDGYSTEEIAEHFGVSIDLCEMRIRTTGITEHLRRYSRKYGSSG